MSQHKTRSAAAKKATPKVVRSSQTSHDTTREHLSNDSKGWLIAFAILVIVVLFFIIRGAVNS